MVTLLVCVLFLLVGFIIGWLGAERYIHIVSFEPHEFEKIIRKNPHPEIFNDDGKLNRENYLAVTFPIGFDCESQEEDTEYSDEWFDDED